MKVGKYCLDTNVFLIFLFLQYTYILFKRFLSLAYGYSVNVHVQFEFEKRENTDQKKLYVCTLFSVVVTF